MPSVVLYVFLFLIPIFIFGFLIVKLLLNNFNMVETRLLSTITFLFCIVLLADFLRHTSSLEFALYYYIIIVFCITLSIIFIMYLLYELIRKYCHKKFSHTLLVLFYIPIIVPLCYVLINYHNINFHFYPGQIWLHNTHKTASVLNFIAVLWSIAIIIIFSLYGSFHSITTHGKQLFNYFALMFSLFFIVLISIVNLYFPSFALMIFMYMTNIIFLIGITRFSLIPSLEQRYKTIFDISPVAILLLSPKLEVLEYNVHAQEVLMTYTEGSTHFSKHTSYNTKQGRNLINQLQKHQQLTNYLLHVEHPFTYDKQTLIIEAAVIPFDNENYYYIMWRNMTESIERDNRAKHLAYHDSLTDLYNRTYFTQYVEKKLLMTNDTTIHAIVLIDLNGFKRINDQYGHDIGDLVLQHMAHILTSIIPSPHVVARIGGDEFVLFLHGLSTKLEVEEYVANIRDACATNHFIKNDIKITISPSIGYSLYGEDGLTLAALLQNSDKNMYINKAFIKQSSSVIGGE